ncbi:hypothetical protein V2A60_004406 [Cordyceps javanica]|uniref:Nonribosomal peptide synthase n=1 Tax=Cordyceps javanica TaxID=43265 RepID=A0A545VQU4_9HYPO|nr:nonribosomal peptide synthase [Cordyceps javanica]TQW04107.1 nonribosomal peptide synthase [Cordyceps javanica]
MPALTEADLDQLWSLNARIPETVPVSVHKLIAQRASTQGDSPCVVSWDGTYSYKQLMQMASNLADYLDRNVQRKQGQVLPILMCKSSWMPVAMLGALMGGWGIAPLDINLSDTKVAQILEQLDPPCILTASEVEISTSVAIPRLGVDRLGLRKQHPSITKRVEKVPSIDLAAVVFTSGSTGAPKAVMLDSKCVATSAACGSQILQLGKDSRVLQFSSFSFDISLHEIFMTLAAGGCLCIPSEAERLNDPVAAINTMQANFICTTPSIMMSIFSATLSSTPITTVVLTGEALTSKITPLFDANVCLYCWYGASECPMATLAPLRKETWLPSQIDYRHPGNCWVVSAEDCNLLCVYGEVGELLVESPMLMSGYLNSVQQTEAAFCLNPEWLSRGSGRISGRSGKLYRTGDLVRINRDGTLDFVGRRDSMVKIYGKRVDLNMTELCIWEHLRSAHLKQRSEKLELVVEAVNITDNLSVACFASVRDESGSKKEITSSQKLLVKSIDHMTEIYTPDSALQHIRSGIDAALREKLSNHMVPTLYFQLPSMPLTATGKIDRKLLRTLSSQITRDDLSLCRASLPDSVLEPQNELEFALRRLWGGILGIEASRIAVTTSFLECGGDSLLAMRLSKALLKDFGLPVTVPHLLRRTMTIHYLSGLLRQPEKDDRNENRRADVSAILKGWVDKLSASSITHRIPKAPEKQGAASVLLTGSTGYLGTYILKELLSSCPSGKVFLLVRAADVAAAKLRVREVAVTVGWWKEEIFDRITICVGDLARPRFDLADQEWEQISHVDMIIHNGAVVNYAADYDVLEATNVYSTFQLLQVVLQSRRIEHFVFISGGTKQARCQSDDEYLRKLNDAEGYTQSKYVAEQLTLAAGRLYGNAVETFSGAVSPSSILQANRTFAVVKPGYIIGDQVTGISNTDDFIWRLVAGAVRMNSYPSDPPDAWLDIAEVTHVARHIVHRAYLPVMSSLSGPVSSLYMPNGSESTSDGSDHGDSRTAHCTLLFDDLDRGMTVERFWSAVQAQTQQHLEPKEQSVWMDKAHEQIEQDMDGHPLSSILPYVGSSLGTPFSRSVQNGNCRTMSALHASAEVEVAVRRCVQYLQDMEFITLSRQKKPEASASASGKQLYMEGSDEHFDRGNWSTGKTVDGVPRRPSRLARSKLVY